MKLPIGAPAKAIWETVQRSISTRRTRTASLAITAGLMVAVASLCQTVTPAVPAASAVKQPALPPAKSLSFSAPFAALDWNTLTSTQQAALKPLAASWHDLSDGQKRKWISLSADYPRMTPTQQTTLHERMAQWAALSARQRAQARLNFAEAQKLDPQKKNEKWQAYQALSPEEKRKLAKSAPPKPPRTALAAKPAPASQINRLTLHKKARPPAAPASAAASLTAAAPTTLPVRPVSAPPPQPSVANEPGKP